MKPYKIKKNNKENQKQRPYVHPAVFKHLVNEAKRLLTDKKYEELRRPTDEDLQIANELAFILAHAKYTGQFAKGFSLLELTIGFFKELEPHMVKNESDPNYSSIPDEIYLPKEAKVLRAINLLKKMALESIIADFEKDMDESSFKDPDRKVSTPFHLICEYNEEIKEDLYYDGFPNTDDPNIRNDLLTKFYKTLGFNMSHIESGKLGEYEITPKGGGMIRYNDFEFDNLPIEEQDKWVKDHPRKHGDMTVEELNDILDNIKGSYVSEQGIKELVKLVKSARELIFKYAQEQKIISKKELLHILIPASINASPPELELYKTKLEDVLYFINRELYPPPKYESRLFDTYKYTKPRRENIKDGKLQCYIDEEVEVTTKSGLVVKDEFSYIRTFPTTDDFYMLPEDEEKMFIEKEGFALVSKTSDHIQLHKTVNEDHYDVVDIDIIHDFEDENGNVIHEVSKSVLKSVYSNLEEDFYTLEEYEKDHLTSKGFVKVERTGNNDSK